MPRGILFIDPTTGEVKCQGIFGDPPVTICNSDGTLVVDNINGVPISSEGTPCEDHVLVSDGERYVHTHCGSISAKPFKTTTINLPLSGSSDSTVLIIPSEPTGNGTFILTQILIRLTTAISGEGNVTIRAGSNLGGNEIILDQNIDNSDPTGIIAGLALASLGEEMASGNNYQRSCNAEEEITVRCSTSGLITSGTIKVYAYGILLP